ncbi:capsular polysaccharide export protein, LipB/KpsS family [Halomonas litopenaei]|uniref:capsular polysaccharide export protein, LipB/KpsS family n=1 Tax=Halomonas litopenaei TaxID=2109328 RepID=UPI003FA10762
MRIVSKLKKWGLEHEARVARGVIKNPVAIFVVGLVWLWKKIIAKLFGALELKKEGPKKITTYVLGFSPWKSYVGDWFPDRELIFMGTKVTFIELVAEIGLFRILKKDYEILQWGFKVGDDVSRGLKFLGIRRWIVEDGFVRSVGLGATRTPPFSLSLDSRTAYFDASQESDLERLLSTYDFNSDEDLMIRARALKADLLSSGVSKYNFSGDYDISEVYGEKTKKRILVVGQVEEDASIEYGCERMMTNNDLVALAALENPDAQIIYKPHPDVLHGHRRAVSDPENVKPFALVLEDLSVPLAESFKTIDHVYTITSQAGFEALLRDIPVTTIGCPFYSGWGLTDDRQPNPRRTRKLTVDEVFAAAYILYPKYFDPIEKKSITPEGALDRLKRLKDLYTNGGELSEAIIEEDERSDFDYSAVREYLEFKRRMIELEESELSALEDKEYSQ